MWVSARTLVYPSVEGNNSPVKCTAQIPCRSFRTVPESGSATVIEACDLSLPSSRVPKQPFRRPLPLFAPTPPLNHPHPPCSAFLTASFPLCSLGKLTLPPAFVCLCLRRDTTKNLPLIPLSCQTPQLLVHCVAVTQLFKAWIISGNDHTQ